MGGLADLSVSPTAEGPSRDERRAACLSMLSVFALAPIGPIAAYVWGRRHGSVFVRRHITTVLIFEALLWLETAVIVPLVVWIPDHPLTFVTFAILWVFQLVLFVAAVVLAVRAWRGRDVADSFLPKLLVDRLPTA